MRMSERKKKHIVIALAVIAAGCILMLAGYLAGGRSGVYMDEEGVHTAEGIVKTKDGVKREMLEQSNVYQQEKLSLETFESFDIEVVNADVSILPSDSFYLEYSLNGIRSVSCGVENGVLFFEEAETEESLADTHGGTFVMWGFGPGWSDRKGEPDYYLKLYVPSDVLLKEGKVQIKYGNLKAAVPESCSLDAFCGIGDIELVVEGALKEYGFALTSLDGEVECPSESMKDCAISAGNGGKTVSMEKGAPDAGYLDIRCERGNIRVKEEGQSRWENRR